MTLPAIVLALPAPTPDQIKHVIGELDHRWSRNTLKALDRLEQAIDAGEHNAARQWAITSGVGTDKILPLRGMPTAIVSNVHEHRHDMAPLMDKLAVAARVLNTHRNKGYQPAVRAGRVIDVLPAGQTRSGILPDSDAPGQGDGALGQDASS